MNIKKLNTAGVSHIIALMVVVVGAGIAGSLALVASHADARYACGSQCNGKSPNWTIPSNGVQCSKSQKLIATKYPKYDNKAGYDKKLTVKIYYSSVCQTMWANFTMVPDSNRYYCEFFMNSYGDKKSWQNYPYVQAATGPKCPRSGNTVMMDDHSPTGAKAADINVNEGFTPNQEQADFTFSY